MSTCGSAMTLCQSVVMSERGMGYGRDSLNAFTATLRTATFTPMREAMRPPLSWSA
jgi:hypothetical protein